MTPGILIANPGPGNGCLEIISLFSFNSNPSFLTSSLNRYFYGSTNFNFIVFGNQPTLCCDLILDV